MNKGIQDYIRCLSNADLMAYINASPDTYLPEAIAFAKEEANSRHLSLDEVRRAAGRVRRFCRAATGSADATHYSCIRLVTCEGIFRHMWYVRSGVMLRSQSNPNSKAVSDPVLPARSLIAVLSPVEGL